MPPKRKAAKDSPEVKECDDTPVESGVIEIDKANVPSHITDEESLKMKEKAPYRRGAKRVAHKADDAPSNPASKDLSEDKENDGTPIESDVVEMDKANVEDIKTDEEPLKKKEKMPARRGAKRGAHKPDDAPQSLALKDESEEKEGDTPLEMDKANVESLKTDEESSEKKEKIPARRGAKRGAHKADDALCNPALKGASAHKESNVAPVGSNIIENDDNVEGLHAIEESSIKKEKLRSRRVAKRGAHKADDAPPNPASEDVSEGKEGVTSVKSDVPEVDKANVESLKTDEESLKKKEHAPSRKGAKRGAHKPDDAPSNPASKDAAEGKEIETPVESNVLEMDKTNVDIIKTVEESLKMKEKVPSRRGAKRGAHKPDEAPSNPDDNVEKTGETNQSNSGENPTVESEAPNKKRGGKKNNKEDNKESPGEIEDKDSPVDMEPKSETETLPKKREGRKNVQEPEKEAEPSKTKKGGRKNVQGVKEAPKPVHEMGSDDASNGSDEPAKEEKGAGKRKGAKDKEDKGSKKTGSEPDEKKSKLDEANEVVSYECEKLNKKGEKWNLKISTWNVAGMRAWVKKNGADYVKEEDADIICFQETKCPEGKVPAEAKVEGYHMFWASGKKDGYAGVALYSKEKPLNVSYGINNKEHDEEGRIITAEFEKFYLVTTYVPNSGQGLKTLPKRMDWDTIFRNYLKDLDAKKPVILCGDLNVAHEEIDLANPKTNTKSAGFTKEERENMTALLKEGFVDSYRQLYPGKTGSYTFWTYMGNARSRNTGWRLDYFVVSERLMDSVCDVAIRNKVLGSDHCPLTLFIHV